MSTLEGIIRTLIEPQTYPEATTKVEITQTQMSLVFLTDRFVYKIKKPVNLGYLDYTSLEKRKYFCEQEVKLNSRFGEGVYLGVVKITSDGKTITLDSPGEVIEYAVKMRRLPDERMMDVLLGKNQVTPEMISRVAEKIAAFHARAETSPEIAKYGNIDTIKFNTEENFVQTLRYIGQVLSQAQYDRIGRYTREFIKDNDVFFQERVAGGRIKDCHGDLHSQHICFTSEGIAIYDCIEFNDRFRYVDVAAEVSFLAMDLDHWGHPDLSRQFVRSYLENSADTDIMTLLDFYKCYFAYVRAKVNCFKMEAPLITTSEKERALADARRYFNLAESYIK